MYCQSTYLLLKMILKQKFSEHILSFILQEKICEIINSILTTSGNITVVIKNLEKDGYIQKHFDPTDKRAAVISITGKGVQLIEQMLPKHIKNINQIFDVLTDDEKLTLKTILKKFKNLE